MPGGVDRDAPLTPDAPTARAAIPVNEPGADAHVGRNVELLDASVVGSHVAVAGRLHVEPATAPGDRAVHVLKTWVAGDHLRPARDGCTRRQDQGVELAVGPRDVHAARGRIDRRRVGDAIPAVWE